jgi:hypothetical protein
MSTWTRHHHDDISRLVLSALAGDASTQSRWSIVILCFCSVLKYHTYEQQLDKLFEAKKK